MREKGGVMEDLNSGASEYIIPQQLPWICAKAYSPYILTNYLVWVKNHGPVIASYCLSDVDEDGWCLDGTDAAGLEGDITHWCIIVSPLRGE